MRAMYLVVSLRLVDGCRLPSECGDGVSGGHSFLDPGFVLSGVEAIGDEFRWGAL
jgi:hypothetical protein